MDTSKAQYSVIEEDGQYFVYDVEQDATVNRWGDVIDEGLFTMSEALATINFLEGKALAHDSGLKTFKFEVDGTEYQARDYIGGVFIDPVLPDNFWTEPLETRSTEHMKHWENQPFIIGEDDFYKAYCLDGGAHDRPSLIWGFDSLDKVIEFLKEKYRK
jgi:hypothetical protein